MSLIAIVVAGMLYCFVNCYTIDEEQRVLQDEGVVAYAALHGMKLDVHKVATQDNWLIEVFRIRNMDAYSSNISTPVLLSHGYECSGFDFMNNPRNESLAFILADNGFDVWAINYRGTIFSNKKLVDGTATDPQPEDYFRATWQYMAERDVPAVLTAILNQTKENKLHIVGHSMGTTIMFSFLSTNHRFDSKIASFTALAPVIKFGDDTSETLKVTFRLGKNLPHLLRLKTAFNFAFGRQLHTPLNKQLKNFGLNLMKSHICRIPKVCMIVEQLLFQVDLRDYNIRQERAPIYYTKYPGGTSLMNMYQFVRQFGKEKWSKMDYNEVPLTGITNKKEYHQANAPTYDYTTVAVPLFLYFVETDQFIGRNTSMRIVEMLGLNSNDYRITMNSGLSHHEMLWGWNARCYIYDDLISRLKRNDAARDERKREFYSTVIDRHLKTLQFDDGCE